MSFNIKHVNKVYDDIISNESKHLDEMSGRTEGYNETDDALTSALNAPGPTYLIVAFPGRSFRVFPAMDAMEEAGTLELVKRLPGTLGDGNVLIFKRG